MARRVLPLRICCVHRSTSSGTDYLWVIGVWALYRLRSPYQICGSAGRSSTCARAVVSSDMAGLTVKRIVFLDHRGRDITHRFQADYGGVRRSETSDAAHSKPQP